MCNFGRGYTEEQFCEFGPVVQKTTFKENSYLSSGGPFVHWSGASCCNFSRGYQEEQFCVIIFNLDQWFRSLFKDISYLELWLPFRSAEWNHLCNFGRGYYEEQFCEIILNLDQWFRRCLFTIFLIWSSGGPFGQRSGSIYAILVEGIMRNNSVKLF